MSYCHADQTWAAWLHNALESYRVPKRLVGTMGLHGTVPARLAPIFRDREELSSGSDLTEEIKQALADSETLVVMCSPAAARSKWVNEEIRQFRALGKQRIYCVIVDGDPQASEPGSACFPPALFESDESAEPLAADARKWADGKSLARLKLVAGILGVRLDDLRQRDQQRKRKLRALAGFAVVAAVVLLAFTAQSRIAEKEARLAQEAQQASAEKMLASFLEQAERLRDVADLETRKTFQQVMTSYLAGLDPADLSLESRRQLGVVLSNQGVILRDEGQLQQAMDVFRNARQVLHALVEESLGEEESLFELSQVEYWIGQVHIDLGQIQQAGAYFEAYAAISDKLHALQPGNADWTMEAAYAQSNLGILEKKRHPSDPEKVIRHYQAALALNEEAARQDSVYQRELADSHADLADAWRGVCDLDQIMIQRIRTVELAALHFEGNPASNRLKQDYAHALSGLAEVQVDSGQIEPAMASLQKSVELQTELVTEDPGNMIKRWNLLHKRDFQAQLHDFLGNFEQSWEITQAVDADMRQFLQQNSDSQVGFIVEFTEFLREYSYRAQRNGQFSAADRLLNESIRLLDQVAREHPNDKMVLNRLAMAYFDYWERNENTLPDGTASDRLARLSEVSNLAACYELNAASRQALISGATGVAADYVLQLLDKGFYETEFLRYCAKYNLCD